MSKESPGHVGTQVELANILGVDLRTVKRWLKEEGNPGHKSDGRYPIKAWQDWVLENGKKSATKTVTEWRSKLTEMQARREEYKLSILKGNHVSRALVDATIAELGVAIKTIVTSLHLLAPSLAGMEAADVEKILREKEDELMLKIHNLPDEVDAAIAKNNERLFAEDDSEL